MAEANLGFSGSQVAQQNRAGIIGSAVGERLRAALQKSFWNACIVSDDAENSAHMKNFTVANQLPRSAFAFQ